uniref:Uncharacterized protein n=1 Tax=Rhizophora mucronata TaxID=61149 RepID=A0A2P2QW37_RHIMU
MLDISKQPNATLSTYLQSVVHLLAYKCTHFSFDLS